MVEPIIGISVPELKLASSAGGAISLPKDLLGKWTLFYFYPKDDTPGCTKQACSYRDNISAFQKLGVQIFGISLDDLASHEDFKNKFHLNFPLLVDANHALSDALGSFGDQEWKGKVYQGLSRDTFLVGPDGKVREAWRKVNPEATVQETLLAVQKWISS